MVQAVVTDTKGGVVRGPSVKSADGKDVFSNSIQLGAADLTADQAGYGRVAQVPLAGLVPGAYELAIGAKSASGRTAAQRIPFTIK